MMSAKSKVYFFPSIPRKYQIHAVSLPYIGQNFSLAINYRTDIICEWPRKEAENFVAAGGREGGGP